MPVPTKCPCNLFRNWLIDWMNGFHVLLSIFLYRAVCMVFILLAFTTCWAYSPKPWYRHKVFLKIVYLVIFKLAHGYSAYPIYTGRQFFILSIHSSFEIYTSINDIVVICIDIRNDFSNIHVWTYAPDISWEIEYVLNTMNIKQCLLNCWGPDFGQCFV